MISATKENESICIQMDNENKEDFMCEVEAILAALCYVFPYDNLKEILRICNENKDYVRSDKQEVKA